MRILLSIFLSVALVVSGNNADYDRQAYLSLCRYHGTTKYSELLPLLKRRFLPYALVNPYRQYWEPIQSDRHMVDMVRRNACPSHWTHQQAAHWLRRHADMLSRIKYNR